jgi:DNA-binding response OmpR family regulator
MIAICKVEKRPRYVLAVDDEEDHLLAYELAFGKEPDLRLITATNTRAAGIALTDYNIDAVLLDLLVPDVGGIVLCRRIKAQARLRHIPIIALSALPADYYAAPALAAGCGAFLQKPCSLAQIVAQVRSCLGAGSAGGGRETRRPHRQDQDVRLNTPRFRTARETLTSRKTCSPICGA